MGFSGSGGTGGRLGALLAGIAGSGGASLAGLVELGGASAWCYGVPVSEEIFLACLEVCGGMVEVLEGI